MRLAVLKLSLLIGTATAAACGAEVPNPATLSPPLQSALERANDNRAQLQSALDRVPAAEREGMKFLIEHMPERDLRTLTAEFLLENVAYAYRAWNQAAWKDSIPKEVFLNDVLPYASVNERRDAWRKDFFERFQPLTKEVSSPGQAAALLNQQIFKLLNVRYSTKRRKPDQSPFESIEEGLASCTGLSILLIDACRAVGVPARFAGTPMWADGSGNHSWVEVWDDGWHFTGAAEPSGDALDQAWFVGRAAKAQRDEPRHAIYAVSFQPTPISFPMIWDRSAKYVYAVNVTDRYLHRAESPPEGFVQVMLRVLRMAPRQRCAAKVTIYDEAGAVVQQGIAKDERFDANDHLVLTLPQDQKWKAEAEWEELRATAEFTTDRDDQTITMVLTETKPKESSWKADASSQAVALLQKFLTTDDTPREILDQQPFAQVPLTREDAERAASLLWQAHRRKIRLSRAKEWKDRQLQLDDLVMPFPYQVFGDKPATGRSLWISMHGGGGAPAQVNDRQWKNQQSLYQPSEGIYLSPRAPTDTWNLWHQPHIDRMFDRLIEDLIVLEEVDPNRVYLMGYSAGGDGVYQLAPRMADRFAAAAMMAGHPNDASPLGLRNLPFTMHVGGKDGAYQRNQVAETWAGLLSDLQTKDPQGYVHWAKIYEGKGHWLDREDAAALAWMAQYTRNPRPSSVVWKQDDVTHERFYWLAVAKGQAQPATETRAQWDSQRITIETTHSGTILVRVDDQIVDMDQPVVIQVNGHEQFRAVVPRTIHVLRRTLAERGDPAAIFCGEVEVAADPAP